MAAKLGQAGLRLDQFGDAAFVHAMHVTTAISAVITLAGALVVLVWMPGRAAAAAPVAQPAAPSGDAQHEDTVVVQIPAEAAPLATAEARSTGRAAGHRGGPGRGPGRSGRVRT